jgi:tRNA threonylcarbamoyladenosine biosynthesis protein TsaB
MKHYTLEKHFLMKLLAIETSTEVLSLGVQCGGQQWLLDATGGAASSRTIVGHVLALLKQAGLEVQDLDGIAFGQGPGSFTGVRTACAIAQGLAYPADIPLVPIGSLLATAEQARVSHGCDQVICALDARMGEVYSARYAWVESKWTCIQEPATLRPAALWVPPDWQAVGNAFEVYKQEWPQPHPHLPATPVAASLLALAPNLLQAGDALDARDAHPTYVRDRVALKTAERLAGILL